MYYLFKNIFNTVFHKNRPEKNVFCTMQFVYEDKQCFLLAEKRLPNFKLRKMKRQLVFGHEI